MDLAILPNRWSKFVNMSIA